MSRIIVWFSCGAASVCTAKLAVDKYGSDAVDVVYCDMSKNEHADNLRFREDVERWIGKRVTVIGSNKFSSVEGMTPLSQLEK